MFADPETIVKEFGLNPGMYVVDLGAGSGVYSFLMAKLVGTEGKIYACEVQKEVLNRMRNDALQKHIGNIEFLWTNIEKHTGTKLADHSMDAALVSNVLFQVEDKPGFINELKRILKPHGKVYIIDWSDSFNGMGPHQQELMNEIKVRALLDTNGFKVEKTFEAGAHHYGLICTKV